MAAIMAVSARALCVYACAFLLFVAYTNCTVTYYSRAYGDGGRQIAFYATLDDNDLKGVCQIPGGTTWVGDQGGEMTFQCSHGYSATATFGAISNKLVSQVVTLSRPGFSGAFATNECPSFNGPCDCGGTSDCDTWTATVW